MLGLIGVVMAMMCGCGVSANAPATPSPSPSTESPPASTAASGDELTIVVRHASGASTTWRLSCRPPGGSHPDPATACRVLERNGATALPAVPKERVCSQVYGGPETATITGTWRGQPVSSNLSRRNGCEISRWNALVGLLPAAGA